MPSHSGRAFTAMELLASLVLASVLMLAVLGVVGSIGRTRASIARHAEPPDAWRSRIEPMLRADLVDAQSVDSDNRIIIKGYVAIDPMTLARTHRPAEVSYLIQKAGTTSVLLRRQTTYAPATGASVSTQIVALDVASVALKDLQKGRQVHVIVTPSKASGPSIDRIIFLQ